jgi:hypothetical protein
MAVYVVNKRKPESYDGKRGLKVYIGRPSIFGNPKTDGSRAEQVECYKTTFREKMQNSEPFKRAVENLKAMAQKQDVYLICWCAPLPCHGEIIKAYLES